MAAPRHPIASWQYAQTINFLLRSADKSSTDAIIELEEPANDGVIIFADPRSAASGSLADALKAAGIDLKVVSENFPTTPLTDAPQKTQLKDIIRKSDVPGAVETIALSVGTLK